MTKFIHIIDRKTAKSLGMRTYFTGAPCKRRQISERAVSNARCLCLLCESLSLFKSYEYKKANLGRVNENRRKSEKAARTAPHTILHLKKSPTNGAYFMVGVKLFQTWRRIPR